MYHVPCGGLLVAMVPAVGVSYLLSNGLYLEWMLLAAFALFAATLALLRIVPRFHRSKAVFTIQRHRIAPGHAWWMVTNSALPNGNRDEFPRSILDNWSAGPASWTAHEGKPQPVPELHATRPQQPIGAKEDAGAVLTQTGLEVELIGKH